MLNRLAKILAVLLVMVILTGLVVAAVVPALLALRDDGIDGSALVENALFPTAIEPVDNGAIFYAEKEGRVRLVRRNGVLDPGPVAMVDVDSDGEQKGLVGLARLPTGELFGAWTRAEDGKLVVGEIGLQDQPPRIIWIGPESVDRGNGGHLEVSPVGDIVVGVGDAGATELIDDPEAPNGKMLALDPEVDAEDQVPEILSSGWRNPFAFAFDEDGRLWVADNAGPSTLERIGLGDKDDVELVEIDENLAPSALVVLPDGDLGICSFLTEQMREAKVDRGGGPGSDPTVDLTDDVAVEPCSVAAAVLADGSIVFATPDEIRSETP